MYAMTDTAASGRTQNGERHSDVGARVRAMRKARGTTLSELAETAGVTQGFLSKFERGHLSISVAALVRVCDALGVPVSSLFESSPSALVRASDAPKINFGGEGVEDRLLTTTAEKRLQVIRSVIQPGGNGGDDLYVLRADADLVHVLEGSIDIILADEMHHLEAGDTLTFDAMAPHTWRNPSPTLPAKVIWVNVPAP